MENLIPEESGKKVIILSSLQNIEIKEPPIQPRNQTSYSAHTNYLKKEFLKDPLFLAKYSQPWSLQEYIKKYKDGNYGTEFVFKCKDKSVLVRPTLNRFIVQTSNIGNLQFCTEFEEFVSDSLEENSYREDYGLIFIDYSKLFKYITEAIWDSVKKYYKQDLIVESLNIEDFMNRNSIFKYDDRLDFILFSQNVLSKDLDCFKEWDLNNIMRVSLLQELSRNFNLPGLEIKNGVSYLALNPEYEVYKYKGYNYWSFGKGVSSYAEIKANSHNMNDIEEEIYLFPSLRDFYSWEYLGIKSRKRCMVCGTILPKGYKGSRCSRENNPECRKKYDRERKK